MIRYRPEYQEIHQNPKTNMKGKKEQTRDRLNKNNKVTMGIYILHSNA